MKKILIAFAALVVLAFAPAANAACTADGQATNFDVSKNSWIGHAAITCTTNNGTDYELRIYLQTNETGSWSISTTAARTTFHAAGGLPSYYLSNRLIQWPCGSANMISPPFSAVRVKAVVENLNSGSINVDYGPYTNVGNICHGQA